MLTTTRHRQGVRFGFPAQARAIRIPVLEYAAFILRLNPNFDP